MLNLRSHRSIGVACFALLPLSACATVGTQSYQPLSLKSPVGRDLTFEVAQRFVTGWPAARVESWPVLHRVIITSRAQDETRDQAVINVLPSGDVTVDVRTQIADRRGQWLVSDAVCASYTHARERVLAEQLLTAVAHETTERWAAR